MNSRSFKELGTFLELRQSNDADKGAEMALMKESNSVGMLTDESMKTCLMNLCSMTLSKPVVSMSQLLSDQVASVSVPAKAVSQVEMED